MRTAKTWMSAVFLMGALAGSAAFLATPTPTSAQPGPGADRSYWRFHDGRWSHWDNRDRRWYYTDGSHWYYHNGRAWDVYRFDKGFGREGFERGAYAPPPQNATIVVPRHDVYVVPR